MNEDFLEQNPKYADDLVKVAEYEQSITPDETPGPILSDTPHEVMWDSGDVSVDGRRLYQLQMKGFLDRVYDSSNYTSYSLKHDPEEVLSVARNIKSMYSDGREEKMHEFPDTEDINEQELFRDIVGYEDIKWLLARALSSDETVNVALFGPPGSGKTLFLRAIASLDGGKFISGSRTTSAGFTDAMFEEKPRFMCIDELDDMDKDDQKALSDYTEEGIIVETKGNSKRRSMKTNTKTFASANFEDEVLEQISNRFTDLHLEQYTKDEFEEVCRRVLTRDHSCTPEHAVEIADAVWNMEGFANVRKAEDVAALSDGDDPKKVIEVLDDYSR